MKKLTLLLCLPIVFAFASERIITLSPAINEMVYALGAGEKVVGNTLYSTFPKASLNVAKVGGYFSPSLEKILALSPTLVIMQKNNHKLAIKLNRLGIKTKVIPIERLEDIQNALLSLGDILNKKEKAQKILLGIKKALDELQGIVKDKKILIVIGHNTSLEKHIFVVGQNLYLDDIITASGNKNALVSSRQGQPILNQENIIATNPDIVILLAHSMKEKHITAHELISPWTKLPIKAGRNKNIYILDKEYAGIPSDRLILFLQDFKKILYDFKSSQL